MSAPERFQVGDTVRCVRGYRKLKEGNRYTISWVGSGYTVMVGELEGQAWDSDRFVLVSRPTPPALDPFAWTSETASSSSPLRYNIEGFIRWSRFCYWAAQSNLAARILPTEAAARTRASNGRDVPPAYVDVRLPVDTAKDWASLDPSNPLWYPSVYPTIEACRRALGAS